MSECDLLGAALAVDAAYRGRTPGRGGVRAAISKEGRRVVCAIPGVDGLEDVPAVTDLRPTRIPGVPGRWRRGFAEGGQWVWSQVERVRQSGDEVMLSGHSYGGAMALVVAALLARAGLAHRVTTLVTFGAPRAASATGAEWLAGHYPQGWRVVLGADIVPWAVLPVGWRHALRPLFLGVDGIPMDRRRGWAEIWRAVRQPGVQVLGDHRMSAYVAAIRLAAMRLRREVGS